MRQNEQIVAARDAGGRKKSITRRITATGFLRRSHNSLGWPCAGAAGLRAGDKENTYPVPVIP